MQQTQQERAALIAEMDNITEGIPRAFDEASGDPVVDRMIELVDQMQRGGVFANDVRLAIPPCGLHGPMLIITGTDIDGADANAMITLEPHHMAAIGRFYLQYILTDSEEAATFMQDMITRIGEVKAFEDEADADGGL